MTTLEPKTESRPKKAGPKTLAEAKTLLASLQKTAIERGIKLPTAGPPKTLDKARTAIADVERSLAGATTSIVPRIKPASTGPALAATENVTSKARAFLAKSPAPKSSSTAKPSTSAALDPQDMSKSQLEAALGRTKDRKQIGILFAELSRREKGEPSRRSIDRASGLSDSELEQAITQEKDIERRQELFIILTRRNKNRK
jgi:hypothetical protein